MLINNLKTIGICLMIAGLAFEAIVKEDLGRCFIIGGAIFFTLAANARYSYMIKKRRKGR